MSAPSVLHEERVALLRDVATLAGYDIEVGLWGSLVPDVVRLNRSRAALFVGDAKATEVPSDVRTRARLGDYVGASRCWLEAGFSVDLVIAHGDKRRRGWARSLNSIVAASGLCVVTVTSTDVENGDWITTASVSLRGK